MSLTFIILHHDSSCCSALRRCTEFWTSRCCAASRCRPSRSSFLSKQFGFSSNSTPEYGNTYRLCLIDQFRAARWIFCRLWARRKTKARWKIKVSLSILSAALTLGTHRWRKPPRRLGDPLWCERTSQSLCPLMDIHLLNEKYKLKNDWEINGAINHAAKLKLFCQTHYTISREGSHKARRNAIVEKHLNSLRPSFYY